MQIKIWKCVLGAAAAFSVSMASAQTYQSPDERGFLPFVPNQQFRVDIMDPSADDFDVGSGVLANVYQTQPGDPLQSGYDNIVFNLDAFGGQTVRLRFAEVDNSGNFNVGVDGVRFFTDEGGVMGVVRNGNFESNDGEGTNVFGNWTVVDQAGGSGSWFAQTGTASPLNGFTVPAPPQGTFAAMVDQTGPGSHVLYQDFTVPAGGGSIEFDLYISTSTGQFVVPSPPTLDYNPVPVQPPVVAVPIMTPAGVAIMALLIMAFAFVSTRSRRMD